MERKSSKEYSELGQSDPENPDAQKIPQVLSDKASSGSGRSDTDSTDALRPKDALSDKASTDSGRCDSENPDVLRPPPPEVPSSEELSDEPPFKIPRQDSASSMPSSSKMISSQPGTSSEDQNKLETSDEGMKAEESKSADSGDQEGSSMDVAICESVLKALNPFILEEEFMACYNRLRQVYVEKRKAQAKIAEEGAQKGWSEEKLESEENKEEINIRHWLKHVLPREAFILNSSVDCSTEVACSETPNPPPADDSSCSLTEGIIPSEEIQDWKAGVVCGRKILKIAEAVEKTNRKKKESSMEDHYHTCFVYDLKSTVKEIAAALGLPQTSSEPTNERVFPDIHDDDTSRGITSLRATDSPASDQDVTDLDSDAGSLRRAERVTQDLEDVHLSRRSSESSRNPEEDIPLSGRSSVSSRNPEEDISLSGRSSVSSRNPEDDSSAETESMTSSSVVSSTTESSPLLSVETSVSYPVPDAPPNSEESERS